MDTKLSTFKNGRIALSDTTHLGAAHSQDDSDEVLFGKADEETGGSDDDDDEFARPLSGAEPEQAELLPFDPGNGGASPRHAAARLNHGSGATHSPQAAPQTFGAHVAYWKAEAIDQFHETRRYILQLDRRQVLELVIEWRYTLAFLVFFFIMGAVMVAYRKEFFDALEALSQAVKTMGLSGYFLIAFLIFLSAFPPMIGYGTFQTLSGFTFGFAKGFPVSYFGALAGAVSCFVLSRYFLHRRVLSLMNRYPNLAAVVRAVEKKGFKLFLLIRLSPYPFNLLNVLFAASDISLLHYTLGTAISLIKIALHVYIGANLTSFTKHLFGEDDDLTESERQAQTVMEVGALIGSILAMGVMVYVYVVAKRAIKEVQHESDEQRAFLGDDPIAMEEAGITDDWVDWNESDDDDDIALRRRHSLDHASPR